MQYSAIRWWLENYDGPQIKKYQDTVITDTGLPIIGIPMRTLRQFAKKSARGNWRLSFRQAQWDSFEEVLLLGLTLAYAKVDFFEKLPYIRQLLPHLDSWVHTDSIAPTLKPREDELNQVWDLALECLQSPAEYTIRFGIILLMDQFLVPQRLPAVIEKIAGIRSERNYVQMAQSWCLAEIAVKTPELMFDLLRQKCLPLFVHNKTIQKMRESYRISQENKDRALALKRKETSQ